MLNVLSLIVSYLATITTDLTPAGPSYTAQHDKTTPRMGIATYML